MDQEPSSPTSHVSVPEIVTPASNDSVDGQIVMISGSADGDVTIRLWDWLSPVAMTTADESGHWSIALHDVEAGDHMYCAEAYRDSSTPAARSKVVAARVRSQKQTSAKPDRRSPHRWKLPPTGFARRLVGHRRSDEGNVVGRQTAPETGREPTRHDQRPAPVPEITDAPLPGESGLPSNENDPHVKPERSGTLSIDSVTENTSFAAELPIDVEASRAATEPAAIEVSASVLGEPRELIDLGPAERVLDLSPPREAATQTVAFPVAAQRIWTERIIVERPPTLQPIDTGGDRHG